MIDANAPAAPRGLGRWLATLLVAVGLPTLLAAPAPGQAPRGKQAGPAPAQEQPQEPEQPPAQAVPEAAPEAEALTPEEEDQQDVLDDAIFVDPKATALMRGSFDPLHAGALIPPNTDRTIVQMARGGVRLDTGLIDRFVKGAARQLTDRENIAAVASGGQQNRIQAIQDGGRYLMLPYVEVPAEQRDRRFLQEFNSRVLAVAPDLLRNHLYARVQAMQALARIGDPQALPLLIEQLRDPEQPLIVKQLAAEGIKRIARESGDALPTADRERAANALVFFLRENPDAYWLARARALQAIGHLRAISGVQNRDQAVFAVEALAALAEEEARPETRAWAAWALGMLEIPASYPQLNFTLATYHMGRLAVDVGERIVELSDPRDAASHNPERVKYLTALIVSPIFSALEGSAELRGSGLRNSRALGPHQQYVGRVHQLVRQLAIASVNLTRAIGSQRPAARDQVIAALNELRAFLNQNPPPDGVFVPGGREFALQAG